MFELFHINIHVHVKCYFVHFKFQNITTIIYDTKIRHSSPLSHTHTYTHTHTHTQKKENCLKINKAKKG